MEILHPVLLILIERIKEEDPLRLPFSHLITIKKKKSFPIKILPSECPKKRPGKIPLFKTGPLLSGMGEEWP
jgi:hypothetical protein